MKHEAKAMKLTMEEAAAKVWNTRVNDDQERIEIRYFPARSKAETDENKQQEMNGSHADPDDLSVIPEEDPEASSVNPDDDPQDSDSTETPQEFESNSLRRISGLCDEIPTKYGRSSNGSKRARGAFSFFCLYTMTIVQYNQNRGGDRHSKTENRIPI